MISAAFSSVTARALLDDGEVAAEARYRATRVVVEYGSAARNSVARSMISRSNQRKKRAKNTKKSTRLCKEGGVALARR